MFTILKKGLTGNIRKKLLINVFITCFFPIMIMGIATFWHSRNIILEQLDVTSGEYGNQLNSSTTLYLKSVTSTVSILSDDSILKNYTPGQNTNEIINLFNDTKESCDSATSIFLLTKENLLISNSGEQVLKTPYTESEIYKETLWG